MDGHFSKICLFLAIIAALFETGLCVRCYQCTSRRDPKCADPISGELRATECSREAVSSVINEVTYAVRGSPGIADVFSGSMFSCLKINSLGIHQNVTVIRGCYYEKMDGRDICTMLRSKIIDQTTLPFCETCTGDACNGSNKIASTVSLASMFLPFLTIYFTRQ